MKHVRILILILCAGFVSVAWGQPPAGKCNNDWTEFLRTNMARWNPCEKVLGVNNVGTIQLKWTSATGRYVESSPAVANGVLYVGSTDNNVYALDASTGALLWSYNTGPISDSSPAVANGVVYVGTYDFNVYALDASTGALLWSYPTGNVVSSSPTVANGVVYVGSDDHNVYALKASTGAPLWSYYTGLYRVSCSPAVANRVVYVGSDDNNVYALDASTGAKLWSYTTSSYVRSSPAVANGVVYIGSDDNNVYALDASTGTLLWSYTTGSYVRSSPAVVNGVVYVGSWDYKVYAFSIGFLSFPLANGDPYGAKISSVFDHDVKADKQTKAPSFYGWNSKARAFTGEEGVLNCGHPPCSEPVGTKGLVGYKNTKDQPFLVTGHYTGGSGCNHGPCSHFLFYTGHSGFDYPQTFRTQIIATADGLLFIPSDDPVIPPDQKLGESVSKFDILALDHGNGFASWFLHVGCEAGTIDNKGNVVCKKTQDFRGIDASGKVICSHDQLVTTGCPVKRGDVVGLVGNKGLLKKTSVSHLHFEVRTGLTENKNGLPTCVVAKCIPVDPYGWTGTESDPYSQFLGGEQNVKLWK